MKGGASEGSVFYACGGGIPLLEQTAFGRSSAASSLGSGNCQPRIGDSRERLQKRDISTLSFLVCFPTSLGHAFLVELDG